MSVSVAICGMTSRHVLLMRQREHADSSHQLAHLLCGNS